MVVVAQQQRPGAPLDVTIRPLQEGDLPAADRSFRMAFGTFLGLPDPTTLESTKKPGIPHQLCYRG